MGEEKEISKVSASILDQILEETFVKLKNMEEFGSELVFEIKKVELPGNSSTEQKIITILRGESP
ncbi:hypothetical protein BK007_10110 [Methanobacterium subterraneum]|uniref:Uncharacterized protein n=1 Tax=Methanobacterium subterraneum TaxID=59277 RepID=A0A2H4VE09_9EURY|nr:hypothetical protein [Methanobacterium subterraneum]AUB56332.1 hypothetical protein BK007_10110 [Methanobacterium subterraneum]